MRRSARRRRRCCSAAGRRPPSSLPSSRSTESTSGLAAPAMRNEVGCSSGSPAASRPSFMVAMSLVRPSESRSPTRGGDALVGPDLQRVAAQREDRPHAEGPRAEELGLQGHDVAVAAGDLEDRVDALVDEQRRAGDGGELDRRRLVVGDVDRVDGAGERAGARPDELGVRVARRPELRGDDEATRRQRRSQHRAPRWRARGRRGGCSGVGRHRGGGRSGPRCSSLRGRRRARRSPRSRCARR